MTAHYYENDLVKLHYYKFGNGAKNMLCFHGFGMHGKQFLCLEPTLGNTYTFWGFDLFFHKQTQLKDQSIPNLKKGISKKQLAALISAFCAAHHIERFSLIGYSMGSHYATVILEELPQLVDEYIVAAPSSIKPGALISFFSKNKVGNKLLEKLMLSKKALMNTIKFSYFLRLIDKAGRNILYNEVGTPELRLAFYACFTYLRHLETDEAQLIKVLHQYKIKSIFIFGQYDKMYLPKIGNQFFSKFTPTEIIILAENHEMINANFADNLSKVLL